MPLCPPPLSCLITSQNATAPKQVPEGALDVARLITSQNATAPKHDERVLGEMEKQIEAIRPRVVLIDPLYSTTSSVDGYMADLANQVMVLKTWRDRYGCSFLIAHHSRKNIDPDSTAREDSWGSQFLNAFLEAGWQIRRNPRLADNEVVVRRHCLITSQNATAPKQVPIETLNVAV